MNVTQNEDLIAARTRQANADAALKELRYREKSGELVKRKEIEKEFMREWKDAVMKVRTKVIAVEALAPQLYGLTVREIAEVLKKWRTDTLNEIAEQFR